MRLRRRSLLALLVTPLWVLPAQAAGIRESADRAIRRSEQTVPPVAAPVENPHKGIALTLGGIGAGLVILGVVFRSGVECKESGAGSFGFECGQTANKGLVIAGVLAGAAGGAAFVIGEGRKSSTELTFGSGAVGVRHRVRF